MTLFNRGRGLCEAVCKKNLKTEPHEHPPPPPPPAEQENPVYEGTGLRLPSGVARTQRFVEWYQAPPGTVTGALFSIRQRKHEGLGGWPGVCSFGWDLTA